MTQQPSMDIPPLKPTPTNGERWNRDKKSHSLPGWSWLVICLAGFLLTACTKETPFVNVTREPLEVDHPHLASLVPPRSDTSSPGLTGIQTERIIAWRPYPNDIGRIWEREIVVPIVIGYSVEGRPLHVYRFGDGHRNLLILAGIHGGYEWNTIALAHEIIGYLKSNQHLIPTDVQLHILPSLNPDGEARAHNFLGRGNANKVDLNRNWNAHWSEELPQFGCWNIVRLTGGSYPLSEPETRALMNYILEIEFDAVISYHSAGLGIFAGGLPATAKSSQLAEAIAQVSNYPYPPIDIGCDYTGTFIDWAARIGIAAVDVELSTHFYTDFEQNLRILKTFLHWSPSPQ